MVFQICVVKGPLGSLRRICHAGNRVICDEDPSLIENKATGIKTPVVKDNGVYYFHMWVKKGEGFTRPE